jgi:hypothetical protein
MRMVLRSYFRMVPNRHLWIVKNIPQWTIVPANISMVKMAYENSKHVDYKKLLDTKSY